ncbi:MAG: caspase family protein [Kofleriaceae bacterium]|nr:caspase family protein [Kofleriaceae bacterium]
MNLRCTVLGFGIALFAPALVHAETVNYAIVIGNNAPPSGDSQQTSSLKELRYADDDAARYFRFFEHLGEARLLTVLDQRSQRRFPGLASKAEAPTLANVLSVVGLYRTKMQADRARGDTPILYFVFSGHGARTKDGDAFLALSDENLTQDVLYDDILAKLPSSYAHLIVDACHAGGVIGVRGDFFDKEVDGATAAVSKEDLLPVLGNSRMKQFPHLGILLSASLGEEAHEWSEIESGVFTHELLSGLLGAADVNGDRQIEYSEIRAFVAAANRNVKDARARPQIVARAPRANERVSLVTISDIPSARLLEGDASTLGRFFIELPTGERYLEAHVANGTETTLLIPAGQAFIRTDTHEATLPSGADLNFADLRWAPRRTTSRGSLEESYRTDLFDAPYGRSYYQGWVDSMNGASVVFDAPGTHLSVSVAERDAPNTTPAVSLAALSGLSGVVALTTGYLTYSAWSDWDDTKMQVASDKIRSRYERYRAIAITSTAVSIASGAAAWWLWPESSTSLAPTYVADGAGLSVSGTW